jgi:hypothetical protein
MHDQVAAAVQQAWESIGRRLAEDSSWVGVGLRPVFVAASENSDLRRLFPFLTVNRLAFSRCAPWPWTDDCPCIGTHITDGYFVLDTWIVNDGVATTIAWTPSPTEAVSIAARHLPMDREVWIRTTDQPD